MSTAFSRSKTTGVTAATPATANLEASPARAMPALRTLGVMRRSDPTKNRASAAFAAS